MMPNEQHLAEHSGIIGEIGRWVLERACADGHRWQNTGQRDNLTMSVNVSPQQLMSRHRARFIELAHTLGMTVAAEGIETAATHSARHGYHEYRNRRQMRRPHRPKQRRTVGPAIGPVSALRICDTPP